MIQTSKKYNLQFSALSVSKKTQLEMPMWSHKGLNSKMFEKIRLKKALKCLQQKHRIRSVADIVRISQRRTTVPTKPHMINPSGIGRKNCGCPPCKYQRSTYGCKDSGECVEMAKALLACLYPKWN
ncbi:hypothetical protein FB45DRAFT_678668, partial [Roridomyces roridus]